MRGSLGGKHLWAKSRQEAWKIVALDLVDGLPWVAYANGSKKEAACRLLE
jgi:hypothetical protein